MTCSFSGGCDRPVRCKGLCHAHYRQHQRGRDLAPISRGGFARLTRDRQRAIASRGGVVSTARRLGWSAERLASELHHRGLS